ncbi:hypothetical protein BU14_0861s0002 [Porphyra umbilicalis]|uniref:Uncharacterized protein n=1 Tax=Porphyra umbilicalis TaxID=2786 RepID=A0A1X6NNS9_PORUM|nr:hypothetical protein BU14_0861s0002 [Porphyra umbilicalis]|eukprot:OSX70190.1 hypothetical protein BU14_0861s0002 [Porphyra umbilicalis]
MIHRCWDQNALRRTLIRNGDPSARRRRQCDARPGAPGVTPDGTRVLTLLASRCLFHRASRALGCEDNSFHPDFSTASSFLPLGFSLLHELLFSAFLDAAASGTQAGCSGEPGVTNRGVTAPSSTPERLGLAFGAITGPLPKMAIIYTLVSCSSRAVSCVYLRRTAGQLSLLLLAASKNKGEHPRRQVCTLAIKTLSHQAT